MSQVLQSFAVQGAHFAAEKAVLEEKLRDAKKEARELRQENALLRDTVSELRAQVETMRVEGQELLATVKHLLRGSGRGAATLPEGQGLLFADPDSESSHDSDEVEQPGISAEDAQALEEDELADRPAKKPRDRKRRQVDEANLRTEIHRSELPENERRCPTTGVELVEVDVKVTSELDYRQAELVRIEHHQVVYGPSPEVEKDRQIEPLVAPPHSPAIEGVTATAGLLAWLLCQKYVLHLPLYRQEDAFARLGVRLSRKTLCDWALMAAFGLEPIAEFIGGAVRAGPVLQLDDTLIKVKRPGPGSDRLKIRQSYLWVLANPDVPAVHFSFTVGRSTEDVAQTLNPCTGGASVEFLVGDGYAGNHSGAREAGLDAVNAGCWAHAIRKFKDAKAEAPNAMALFVEDIDRIYEIESQAQEQGLGPDERLALRRKEALPVVLDMLRQTSGWRTRYNLGGKVADAMTYIRGQRRALLQFLRDGRVPIDNNTCERAIRPVAMGRKNWLFAGSVNGARAAATIYTVVESAKLSGVDPLAYIEAVLGRLGTCPASEIETLMPWRMVGELPAYDPRA